MFTDGDRAHAAPSHEHLDPDRLIPVALADLRTLGPPRARRSVRDCRTGAHWDAATAEIDFTTNRRFDDDPLSLAHTARQPVSNLNLHKPLRYRSAGHPRNSRAWPP